MPPSASDSLDVMDGSSQSISKPPSKGIDRLQLHMVSLFPWPNQMRSTNLHFSLQIYLTCLLIALLLLCKKFIYVTSIFLILLGTTTGQIIMIIVHTLTAPMLYQETQLL